jgi:A/G-specific adenine glycosylase
MDKRYFSEKLVEWYKVHKRDLPWRATDDAYKIWLSEIILQQTRVNQGLPYYLSFVQNFPDVYALARASEQDVLRLWQGLGYYTRARNLHKCAKEVVNRFNGDFPKTYHELLTLPGIGDYTAAAIASFSAHERVAVVDGNVFRVLARIFANDTTINSPLGKKTFSQIANELVSAEHPHLHNQAMMEFGALWCTPQQPQCENCIFKKECKAYKQEIQHLLPVKQKPKKSRKRYFYYFVMKKGDALLMRKRSSKDIWQGLFDFYLVETKRPSKIEKIIGDNEFLKLTTTDRKLETTKPYRHLLSHQTIVSKFVIVETAKDMSVVNEESLQYYSLKKVDELPKPVLIGQFLKDYNFL